MISREYSESNLNRAERNGLGLSSGLPTMKSLFAEGNGLELRLETRREDQIEIVIVMAGHQSFGLLLSQVYNILRPQNDGINVLKQPGSAPGQVWGSIEYQGGELRVLELARMLHRPLVEPIDRSRILLTGKLLADGRVEHQYGLAVDDVLAVQRVGMEQLRLLPAWMCQKKLGKLVWGTALLERHSLEQHSALHQLQTEGLLTPLQFAIFQPDRPKLGSTVEALSELGVSVGNELTIIGANGTKEKLKPAIQESEFQPLILLDLAALIPVAYS